MSDSSAIVAFNALPLKRTKLAPSLIAATLTLTVTMRNA